MVSNTLGYSCKSCAYWRRSEAVDGSCRLLAPRPGDAPNLPAHWARTRPEDFCGSWLAAKANNDRRFVDCARCLYWVHAPGGITPIDLADELPGWWTLAGHCNRHPPRASTLSAIKAHWLVTHASDGCFEGAEKL